jgi:hypothetical protein
MTRNQLTKRVTNTETSEGAVVFAISQQDAIHVWVQNSYVISFGTVVLSNSLTLPYNYV